MKRAVKLLILYTPTIIIVATLFIWYAVFTQAKNGTLAVSFFDVGQGDAIFIESPTERQILIDGGPDKTVLSELGEVMPFYDHSIDIIIATHPDMDHIGGLPDVLKKYKISMIMEPGTVTQTAHYKELDRLIDAEEGAIRIVARRGQMIDLGGGAILKILFPDREVSNVASNLGSIVALLEYDRTSFLLMGDAPSSIEKYISLLDGSELDVDVLKVGHHGSDTSTTDTLLGLSSPKYGIISSGRNNRYGHPHKRVLEALKRFNTQILRTDQSGRIEMISNGSILSIN